MATHRVIKGVLGTFLGTYVSRYTEYKGYWLFGFLVGDLEELEIDLLGQGADSPLSPTEVAISYAVAAFDNQRERANLERARIARARLTIRRQPDPEWGTVNGHSFAGSNLRYTATAVMDNGRLFEKTRVVFVAPHNPKAESRSAR